MQAKICTNENSARLNNPMKQKKKTTTAKTSNTCTLSVYIDLDELRLWSAVFIIHLVVAREGKKNIFLDFCTKLLLWMTKKKPIKNIMPTTKKSIFTHSANL